MSPAAEGGEVWPFRVASPAQKVRGRCPGVLLNIHGFSAPTAHHPLIEA